MKKLICIFILALSSLGLVGCGASNDGTTIDDIYKGMEETDKNVDDLYDIIDDLNKIIEELQKNGNTSEIEFYDFTEYCTSEYYVTVGLDIYHMTRPEQFGNYGYKWVGDEVEYIKFHSVTGTIWVKLKDDSQTMVFTNRYSFIFWQIAEEETE